MKQRYIKSACLLLILFFSGTFSRFAFAQDTFVQLSPFGSDAGASNGVAWGDFDGDGDEDIYICNGSDFVGQANFLYRNDGGDLFTKITSGEIVTDAYISAFCTWGDFDNDNDLDLYVSSLQNALGAGKQNCLYENLGNGTFLKNTTAGPPVSDQINSAAVGWGDYNNDSHLDLFVTNGYTGPIANTLYSNDGDKTFTSITGIDLVSSANATGIAGFGWADYDGDGDLDLFTASGGGANREKNFLWRNDGGNVFVKLTLFDAGESQGGSWGDYDNDGDLDLYITNYGTSETTQEKNFLYRNDGGDTFTKMSAVAVGDIVDDPIISKGSAWGDIDNDGDLDMFVTTPGDITDPNYDYANRLYINDGSGYFTRLTGSVIDGPGFCFGAAMADYNKDGFLDILVATSNANLIYKNNEVNNGNPNHYIQFKLVGTVSNRSAIGAKVRIRATINSVEKWQMREIAGITGFGQNSLLAHFGLGDASTISEVRVQWPSGIVQTLTNVSANQILTITESGSSASVSVTSPNGGENWQVGGAQTITWSSQGTSGTVKLEYSTNNGTSWTDIVAGTADDGSHDWTVPNTPSSLCLVRVSDMDGSPSDVSDGVFTISAATYQISGTIGYDATGRPVSDAAVALTSVQGSDSRTTDGSGNYTFATVAAGDVTLEPSKSGDLREAISGSDALYVLQYLAFLAEMNAEQEYAADVTEDGSVSGSDAQAIMRYLAFFSDNIASTGQWRFLPASTSFTLVENAVVNFSGYLKGDANLSWGEGGGLGKQLISPMALEVGQVEELDESRVSVPVVMRTSGETLNTFIFSLSYDAGNLRYVATERSELSRSFMLAANGATAGEVHLAMADVPGMARDGEIVRLVFERRGSLLGDFEVTRAVVNDRVVQDIRTASRELGQTEEVTAPDHFALQQNYPNPFNPNTWITFQLPKAAHVTLKVFSLLGEEIVTLLNEMKETGIHRVSWSGQDHNGQEVPSGIYLIDMQAGGFRMNQKMLKVQ